MAAGQLATASALAPSMPPPYGASFSNSTTEASRVYDNEVYDRSIDVLVLRLRRKIETQPSQPQFIVTERGVGYKLSSAVEVLY